MTTDGGRLLRMARRAGLHPTSVSFAAATALGTDHDQPRACTEGRPATATTAAACLSPGPSNSADSSSCGCQWFCRAVMAAEEPRSVLWLIDTYWLPPVFSYWTQRPPSCTKAKARYPCKAWSRGKAACTCCCTTRPRSRAGKRRSGKAERPQWTAGSCGGVS